MRKTLAHFVIMSALVWIAVTVFPTAILASSCFDCHQRGDFQGQVVHQPVAENRCDQCHNPHVARHSGLLLKEQKELCQGCHVTLAKRMENSQVLHQPVKEGNCGGCHDPHAAAVSGLLDKPEKELCLGCHEELEQAYSRAHRPFQEGRCGTCHDPHGGDDYRLLKDAGAGLCLGCHKNEEGMRKSHLGRESRGLDCLGCHHPHGAQARGLLRGVKHKPFAQGNCQTCHGKSQGADACLGCHKEVLSSFNRTHSHLQSIDGGNPCIACHNPHVGDRAGLLPANEGAGCRACHAGTFARRAQMLHQHPGWNKCSDCHDLHGSDWPGMVKNSAEDVCAGCHERHKSFSHPQGDSARDPRNGVAMNCMSCHDANVGTMYKYFLHGSAERGLCVQCHLSY